MLRLQGELDQTLNVLTSMRGLFDASEEVARDEFRVMAAPILERDPDILALDWAPKVTQAERQPPGDRHRSLRESGKSRGDGCRHATGPAREHPFLSGLTRTPLQRRRRHDLAAAMAYTWTAYPASR